MFRHIVLLVVSAGILAACTAPAIRDEGGGYPAELEHRAVERWQLLIDGRSEQAYDYLTPGYRATMGRQEYARNALLGAIKWTGARWRDAQCSAPDTCTVEIQLDYSVRVQGAGDAPGLSLQEESWLKVDGEWYFLPTQ